MLTIENSFDWYTFRPKHFVSFLWDNHGITDFRGHINAAKPDCVSSAFFRSISLAHNEIALAIACIMRFNLTAAFKSTKCSILNL